MTMPAPYAAPCEVRPELDDFAAYVPGLTIEEIQARYRLPRVIKLASNENPLGVPPLVQKALRDQAGMAFRYPQGGLEVEKALGAFHGLDPACIVTGNGSDELIDLLIRVRAVPGQHNVAGFRPCFGMYPVFARLNGVEFRQTPLNADFSFPWEKLRSTVDGMTALVFVTTPDNPSGFCPPVAELLDFAASLPKGAFLVVDEAYMDFCDDEAAHSIMAHLAAAPNAGILRTFSKSFGLAGLRLGYAILPQALALAVRKARSPFSVNRLAEAAGLAALADTAFRRDTLRTVHAGRAFLSAALAGLGFEVYPSQANFIMVRPPAGTEAAQLHAALLERGFIIRPLAGSYQLPQHLRITIGTDEENQLLVRAIAGVLHA